MMPRLGPPYTELVTPKVAGAVGDKYRLIDRKRPGYCDRACPRERRTMPDTHVVAERPAQDEVARYDAIVIGAGISGMFMLYRLRELGMTARVFEAGSNLGGTGNWNRYPGARFDSDTAIHFRRS